MQEEMLTILQTHTSFPKPQKAPGFERRAGVNREVEKQNRANNGSVAPSTQR